MIGTVKPVWTEKKFFLWAISAAEQAGANHGEDFVFTRYFREGIKALMLALTEEETSLAQYLIGRLRISIRWGGGRLEECHQVNTNQHPGTGRTSCE